MSELSSLEDNTFVGILNGSAPGKVIARDVAGGLKMAS